MLEKITGGTAQILEMTQAVALRSRELKFFRQKGDDVDLYAAGVFLQGKKVRIWGFNAGSGYERLEDRVYPLEIDFDLDTRTGLMKVHAPVQGEYAAQFSSPTTPLVD